ncbi:MAG: hypothetical protein E6J91_19955 [Deltaproteobacteria bacterium]|nr:MAG: hypothetical protein E6J91_19955 [Deltaproteobacteria bacterium]
MADIKQMIATGRAAYDKGLLEKSETALRSAVQLIRRNPALLVLDTNNEQVVYNAFVSLAMTLSKRGKSPEAMSVMIELLRISSAPIPENDFGPKARDLHTEAEKQAQATGRGALTVSASDNRAMIFVDYKYRGLGKVALGDQLPGSHAVLVQIPGTIGLQYEREVRASATSALDVNWPVESALHLDGLWAGFLLAADADRAKASLYATEFARSCNTDDIIILSLQTIDGISFLGGIQYPANGDPPIGAFAPLSGGEPLLRALGTYLYDGTMAAGLRVLRRPVRGEAPSAAQADSNTTRPTSAPSWAPSWVSAATMGAGTLTIIGGAVAYARTSYDEQHRPSDGTDGRNPSVGVMLGGSLVLGGGVYLWSRDSFGTSRLTAGALGIGVASIAAGVEYYLVAQEPLPTAPRYIRDTATAGIVVGAAGLAVTGAGVWLLHRDRAAATTADANGKSQVASRHAWTPYVSAGATQALFGCAGSF